MGAPLSAAEKLQAIPGDLTTWLNELLKKYVLEEDTLTENMDWDVSRGKPFQNVASMTYMCWYTDSRKAVSSPDLKKWLLKSVEVSPCLLVMSLGFPADGAAGRLVQEEDGDRPFDNDTDRQVLQVYHL
jgi:hypothetical protein